MSLLDFILQVLFSKSQEASPQKKKKKKVSRGLVLPQNLLSSESSLKKNMMFRENKSLT